MISQTAVVKEIVAKDSAGRGAGGRRLRAYQLLALSLWCGLVAGPLEVGATRAAQAYLRPQSVLLDEPPFRLADPPDESADLPCSGHGVLAHWRCAAAAGAGWAARLLCALTLLAPLWAAFPRIYGPAGFLLALGVAARLVPILERHAAAFRRCVLISFPVLAAITPLLAASVWAGDWLKEWSEAARPLPPAGSPNVMLIVLDTVAAGHLSLHGYDRPTSPTLEGLARRGVRFDRVQATSSWTLPSHASFFTGRWPHELSAGWLTPLDATYPTLAEYLGSRGYATAGFVANTFYCGADTGLGRGFTDYRDYIFPRAQRSQAGSPGRSARGRAPRDPSTSSGSVRRLVFLARPALEVRRGISQAGGGGQSRVPRLAVRVARSRSGRSSPS